MNHMWLKKKIAKHIRKYCTISSKTKRKQETELKR